MLNASNIDQGVARLRSGKFVELTVLLNKYDGIDLPGDACRVLVIDGLPGVYGLAERVEFAALDGTEAQLVNYCIRFVPPGTYTLTVLGAEDTTAAVKRNTGIFAGQPRLYAVTSTPFPLPFRYSTAITGHDIELVVEDTAATKKRNADI